MEFQRVSKKAMINMLIPAVIWTAILAAAAAVVWFAGILPEQPPTLVCLIYWLAFGLLFLVLLISPWVRHHRYRYQIDNVRVAKQEGLIFLTTELAPIERVHQIAVLRGPIDRLTGLAKVVATTAGGEITIRFLEHDVAFALAEKLEATIKQIVHAQGEVQ